MENIRSANEMLSGTKGERRVGHATIAEGLKARLFSSILRASGQSQWGRRIGYERRWVGPEKLFTFRRNEDVPMCRIDVKNATLIASIYFSLAFVLNSFLILYSFFLSFVLSELYRR